MTDRSARWRRPSGPRCTPGIVLDFSHGSAADLDFGVVWYAKRLGWDGGQTEIDQLVSDWDYFVHGETPIDYPDEEDFHISYRDALLTACEDAVDWLNDQADEDGLYYLIDDNSLYCVPLED